MPDDQIDTDGFTVDNVAPGKSRSYTVQYSRHGDDDDTDDDDDGDTDSAAEESSCDGESNDDDL